jgi:hypothetical protein
MSRITGGSSQRHTGLPVGSAVRDAGLYSATMMSAMSRRARVGDDQIAAQLREQIAAVGVVELNCVVGVVRGEFRQDVLLGEKAVG